jgi:branched-chain amino acid transport system substrate-binding protein
MKRREFLVGAAGTAAAIAAPSVLRAQANTYKIGTILSVTGPGAFLGDNMKRGMELAIDEINAAGGIGGKKIEWAFYDAETQSSRGVTATRRLVEQDKAVAMPAASRSPWCPSSKRPACPSSPPKAACRS